MAPSAVALSPRRSSPVVRRALRFGRRIVVWPFAVGVVAPALRAHLAAQQPPGATVTVWVISAETGIPLEGAEVLLHVPPTLPGAFTDSVGRAVIRGLPPLANAVQVRHIGYRPQTVVVPLDSVDTIELTIALQTTAVVVEPVITTARKSSAAPGFDARRQLGTGHFFDRAEIERRRPRAVTDLLRLTPGLRVERGPGGYWVRSSRSLGPRDCPLSTYVDGVAVTTETRPRRGSSIFDTIPIDMVEALEVYAASEVPAQYNRGASNCGVVLIWTRAERPER
jgi:hypothetical protein